MIVPRLHVVTTDALVAAPRFEDDARALIEAHGPRIALHLRGRATPARRLLDLAERLLPAASATGSCLLVNDRVDVALAAGAHGVHLGMASLPPESVRTLVGDRLIGRSVHGPEEAADIACTDFLFLGTIFSTPSHPDQPGIGPSAIAAAVTHTRVPVLAIGGISPDRVADVMAAGAHGVACIRGIWSAGDPAGAAEDYLDALDRAARSGSHGRTRVET